jgi:uncharacterized protein (UPF0332 family)
MKPKIILLNALQRQIKLERGLRVTTTNNELSKGHIDKSSHNLVVMTDLNNLQHSDWVVIAAYYAMYHASMSVLSKIGVDSKDHTTTVAVLEYFFSEKLEKSLLDKFNELKKKKDKLEKLKIEEKYIDYLWKTKKTRETVQYGIQINYTESDIIMSNAREFVTKIKLLLDDIDEDFINIAIKEVQELLNSIKKL